MFPLMFLGHGSPMNIIEKNRYTQGWAKMAASIAKPDAILCISAHWVTKGTKVSTVEQPETIHDFYGFPQKLYEMQYPAKGAPELAFATIKLLGDMAKPDRSWGLDHGTWGVLNAMYPKADIPVYQMSIDTDATPEMLLEIGRRLKPLREQKVLIIGSGNIVHNLGKIDFSLYGGFEWAQKFNEYILKQMEEHHIQNIVEYQSLGNTASQSVPTTEHFYPLFYLLGAAEQISKVTVYNNFYEAGSLSMTSYMIE